MAHKDMIAFAIEIKKEADWSSLNEVMTQMQDALIEYEQKVAKELGISNASQICYLRTRSRWTPQLEDRIVCAMKDGHFVMTVTGEEEEELQKLGY